MQQTRRVKSAIAKKIVKVICAHSCELRMTKWIEMYQNQVSFYKKNLPNDEWEDEKELDQQRRIRNNGMNKC